MPERRRLEEKLGASEHYRRAWATWRLNRCLARYAHDPLLTNYRWQLVTLEQGHPISWREFAGGQIGGAWMPRLWAFTTLTFDEHRLLIGAWLAVPRIGSFWNTARITLWPALPEPRESDQVDEPWDFTQFYNRHQFHQHLLHLP